VNSPRPPVSQTPISPPSTLKRRTVAVASCWRQSPYLPGALTVQSVSWARPRVCTNTPVRRESATVRYETVASLSSHTVRPCSARSTLVRSTRPREPLPKEMPAVCTSWMVQSAMVALESA
jgi:hypothetical protein